jgi:hypothetical protein
VIFNLPAAPIVTHHKEVESDATLRDPSNFVIGNVFRTWHVDVTDQNAT